jgi:hypothetical protein
LGRYTEGSTEGTAEIAGAEANQSGENFKGYRLGEMFLDISDSLSPLPYGEAEMGAWVRCPAVLMRTSSYANTTPKASE